MTARPFGPNRAAFATGNGTVVTPTSRAQMGSAATQLGQGARAVLPPDIRHPDPKVRAARANGAWQRIDSPLRTCDEVRRDCHILIANADPGDPRIDTGRDILGLEREG